MTWRPENAEQFLQFHAAQCSSCAHDGDLSRPCEIQMAVHIGSDPIEEWSQTDAGPICSKYTFYDWALDGEKSGLNEKLSTEEGVICPDCGGTGITAEVRLWCCGAFEPDGHCCEDPDPEQIQEQCEKCQATGRLILYTASERPRIIDVHGKEDLS